MPPEENTNQVEICGDRDGSQSHIADVRDAGSVIEHEDEDPERWDGMS